LSFLRNENLERLKIFLADSGMVPVFSKGGPKIFNSQGNIDDLLFDESTTKISASNLE
jgi:hypothetical protein